MMKISAKIVWKKKEPETFIDGKYSRVHSWYFDEGSEVMASSSPEVVPVPMSDASAVDPEEAFLASLSSCHMLFFLSIAAHQNYCVTMYEDNVQGTTAKNKEGKMAIDHIELHPKIIFSDKNKPSVNQVIKMHKMAHSRCYIANSIRPKISIIPNNNINKF